MREVLDPKSTATLLINIAAVFIYFFARMALNKIYKEYSKKPEFSKTRRKNSLKIFHGFIRFILVFVLVLFILQNSGLNITSILTSLGITGAVIGLALQDYLKDCVMGFNIIASHYFSVGDVISCDGFEGIVVYSDMKITKIESIDDYSIMTISNRNLDKVIRSSNIVDINIPLSYEDDFEKCRAVISTIAEKAKEVPGIERAELKGPQAFEASAITYKLRIHCKPAEKNQLKREVNYLIQKELAANGLTIPYQQIDIHTKA